jgi:hypothetical protein
MKSLTMGKLRCFIVEKPGNGNNYIKSHYIETIASDQFEAVIRTQIWSIDAHNNLAQNSDMPKAFPWIYMEAYFAFEVSKNEAYLDLPITHRSLWADEPLEAQGG